MLAGAPETWDRTERQFRCIAVVGSGASAPFLKRGDDLAKELIQQFHVDEAAIQAERERLERITAVDPREFEAQLAALGQTLGGDRRVRTAVSELYQVRHPTIQAYELVAHLLKHRFLDAVINMNFDELLDQSLEDELGADEYQRIVSDRDCVSIQTNELASDYVPLYIKLHGTASEPESLRFTRESYYDSPARVGAVTADLFSVPECVVVNIGFGMGSFDLHRLLALPERLWLFDLSKKRLDKRVIKAITRERLAAIEDESTRKSTLPKGSLEIPPPPQGQKASCDDLLTGLLANIEKSGNDLLKAAPGVISLRSVTRHDAVVDLLGPESGPGRRLIKLPRRTAEARFPLDPQAMAANPDRNYADYLLRRTVLELSLAMARGRGLLSVGTLAIDRGGHYFDAYLRRAKENPWTWKDLCTLVGFKQNPEVPDVFEAAPEIRLAPDDSHSPSEESLRVKHLSKAQCEDDEWHELPQLDIPRLVDRVLPHVVDSPSSENVKSLTRALKSLHDGTEYELHSRDDRVCSKTFSYPQTLKTLSSLDAYSFRLMKTAADSRGGSQLDIISETGQWPLQHAAALRRCLESDGQIRLILAFYREVPTLLDLFDGIELSYMQPWHHNRHMVIVKDSEAPPEAVYFARHHRTPYVTPVFVYDRADIQALQTTFDDRWIKSTPINHPGVDRKDRVKQPAEVG